MTRTANPAFAGATILLDASLRDQIRLAWRLIRDDRVNGIKFLLPALVALYVVSPVDPIPDFLLGIGQMDDLGVVIAALVLLVRIIPRLAPAAVVSDHLRQMGRTHEPPSPAQHRPEHQVFDADFTVRTTGN